MRSKAASRVRIPPSPPPLLKAKIKKIAPGVSSTKGNGPSGTTLFRVRPEYRVESDRDRFPALYQECASTPPLLRRSRHMLRALYPRAGSWYAVERHNDMPDPR